MNFKPFITSFFEKLYTKKVYFYSLFTGGNEVVHENDCLK